MVRGLLRHPLFIIGFIIVFGLLTASFIHATVYDGYIPSLEDQLTKKDDSLLKEGSPPYNPEVMPPMGSDLLGKNLFVFLISGAKYTIGIALIVGFLRVVISLFAGIFYGNYLMRVNKYVASIIDAFHFIPVSLLAYLILNEVLVGKGTLTITFEYSFPERVIFELVILTIIAIPTTSLLIGNQTNLIMNKEFITCVRTLGAGKIRILRKHVIPHLMPKLVINYLEQIVQVLILLVHLGLFHLMFGGTRVVSTSILGDSPPVYDSLTGEWSGIIGESYRQLFLYPWMALFPLMMFAIVILAFNFMQEGVKDALTNPKYRIKGRKKKRRHNQPRQQVSITDESFQAASGNQSM